MRQRWFWALEPEAGMAIDAYIWLQGRIIDIDEAPQQ